MNILFALDDQTKKHYANAKIIEHDKIMSEVLDKTEKSTNLQIEFAKCRKTYHLDAGVQVAKYIFLLLCYCYFNTFHLCCFDML